jgi:hypothetical protein
MVKSVIVMIDRFFDPLTGRLHTLRLHRTRSLVAFFGALLRGVLAWDNVWMTG